MTSPSTTLKSDSERLGLRARQSVLWNTGMSLVTNVGQFGLMLVLVRILTPAMYGQFGLLMAVMGALFVFSAQGAIDFAVQTRDEEEIPISEILFFSVGMSVVLCVVANIVAVFMRRIPEYSDISELLHLMSLTFLLHPPRAYRVAMLQRNLDWRRIRCLHLVGFITSAAFAIGFAYGGAGVYALIVSSFLVPIPYIVDLFWKTRWRVQWKWDFTRFEPALRFGINRLLSNMLSSGRRLLESTFMVQMLGFTAFGVYGRSVSLSNILCGRLTGLTLEAVYPAITKIETESDRFRRVSALLLRSCVWGVCPLAFLSALLADPMVKLLLGNNWLGVIPILPWTFAAACAGSIAQTLYRLLLGHDQQRHCLYLDMLTFAGIVCALALLLPNGVINYLQGVIAIQAISVIFSLHWLIRRGGIASEALTTIFVGPVVPLAAAWIAFDLSRGVVLEGALPLFAQMTLQAVCFMSVYVFSMRVLFARQLSELVPYMPLERPVRRLLSLG